MRQLNIDLKTNLSAAKAAFRDFILDREKYSIAGEDEKQNIFNIHINVALFLKAEAIIQIIQESEKSSTLICTLKKINYAPHFHVSDAALMQRFDAFEIELKSYLRDCGFLIFNLNNDIEAMTGEKVNVLSELSKKILDKKYIDDHDVRALSACILAQKNILAATEVEWLFTLNRDCIDQSSAWDYFLVNILSHYYCSQFGISGIWNEKVESDLISYIEADKKIDTTTEFRLLINIIAHQKNISAYFREYVLNILKINILESEESLFSRGIRKSNSVDSDDIEALRLVIYGHGSEETVRVSQKEAEYLFDIQKATQHNKNAVEWEAFFTKAIAQFLLQSSQTPDKIDDIELAWLQQHLKDCLATTQEQLFNYLKKLDKTFDPQKLKAA